MTKLSEETNKQLLLAIHDYTNTELLIGEICKKYGLDLGTLNRFLEKSGIPRRTRSQSAALFHKTLPSFQKEDGTWIKICKQCKNEQPVEKFQPDKEYSDGRTSVCYDCRNEKRRPKFRERYKNDPEFREQRKKSVRKHYKENPEAMKHYHKKTKFNMSSEEFDLKLEETRK